MPRSTRPSLTGSIQACLRRGQATSAEGKGVARQGFNLFNKIIAIDCLLREQTSLVERVFECHPEVSFLGDEWQGAAA